MSGKLLVYSLIGFILFGCARPKYIQESGAADSAQPDSTSSRKTDITAECAIVFSETKYCLSWYWENKPTSKQAGSLIFKMYRLNQFDKTAVAIDPAGMPAVVLWMPSMGHGSTPTQTTRLDVGTYRASNVFFIMPGEWDIRFSVKDESDASKPADGVSVAITI